MKNKYKKMSDIHTINNKRGGKSKTATATTKRTET